MEWYYADAGQRVGPVPEREFEALRSAGKIGPETLVWTAGMQDWRPWSAVQTAQSVPVGPAAPAISGATGIGHCTQCGREFPDSSLLVYGNARICESCKDSFFQTVREQGPAAALTHVRRYGGFWIRFLARIIDGLIVSVVLLPLGFVFAASFGRNLAQPSNRVDPSAFIPLFGALGVLYILELAAIAAYEGWFLSRRGATPGKLVLGLKVVRPDGQNVSFARGASRFLGQILSGLILYIGYLIAAFDSEKRALHDHLCDTRVIYK